MATLSIGTSGYSYKDWRGTFYPKGVPQKHWLAFYAQHFNAVEINATFYRFFPEHVFAHWHDATPAEFRFVLKAPKVITHEKALREIDQELQQFVTSAAGLHEKLDAMLWQFPANVSSDQIGERFAEFLPLLPPSIKQVFEFRHTSWFTEATYALLNELHAGVVINDSSRFPSKDITTDQVMYVRFHGPGKLYSSSYNDEQMRAWANRIKPRLAEDDVYLFFNNTSAGQALSNANQLRELLTG